MELPLSRSGRTPLEVAQQAALEGGKLLRSRFRRQQRTSLKGRGNFLTEADLLSEKVILGRLREEFPGWGVISEESPPTNTGSPYTWVVDPMDGTNNYAFGIPFFCVCVALRLGEQTRLGVTYDPIRRELFWAEAGGGAFVNGKPIAVSTRQERRRSLIACDLGYDDARGAEMLDFMRRLWPDVHSLRVLGSGALGLAYVAAGRIDLYLHRCLYPWDIAAGVLLVHEAGGKVSDWSDNPITTTSQEIIAGTPAVHSQVMALIAPRPT